MNYLNNSEEINTKEKFLTNIKQSMIPMAIIAVIAMVLSIIGGLYINDKETKIIFVIIISALSLWLIINLISCSNKDYDSQILKTTAFLILGTVASVLFLCSA